MAQIHAEQADFLLESVYQPGLRAEFGTTKKIFGAIPHDKSDYKPDSVSKSAMQLAWHIVATELRFLDAVAAGEFDLTPRPKPESIVTPADLVAWYDDEWEKRFDKLSGLSGEQLTQVIDFRGMFQLPAVMYLGFVMSHTVHHRGQLSMYLRPMGAKVPSIYGESYDSEQARKGGAGA